MVSEYNVSILMISPSLE